RATMTLDEAPLSSLPNEDATPVDTELLAELPTFELFFKTFGFKRVHGRVWGLLVLASEPLASKDISSVLSLSQAATSGARNELAEWGAIRSTFDSSRRCHVHSPVGNALSIVATVFRRREQVVFQQFKLTAERALAFVRKKYGERDPRVLTLRSIIATCAIGEAMMQLVFGAVQHAMSDSESVLSRAVHAALKVGVGKPARWLFGGAGELMAAAEGAGSPAQSAGEPAASAFPADVHGQGVGPHADAWARAHRDHGRRARGAERQLARRVPREPARRPLGRLELRDPPRGQDAGRRVRVRRAAPSVEEGPAARHARGLDRG